MTMAKENKTMDQIHRGLLKKFHTLCSVLGLSEDQKSTLLQSWGVESSRDLSQHQLIDICAKLSEQVNHKDGTASLDKLRKQLIAAIGCWLRETSQEQNISKIRHRVPCVRLQRLQQDTEGTVAQPYSGIQQQDQGH